MTSKTQMEKALCKAAEDGKLATVQFYLDNGVDINCTNDYGGYTPLHFAAVYGRLEIVRLLVEKGAVIEAKNNMYGWTALHSAAFGGHLEIVCLLIEKGAAVDAKEDDGQTPLHYAALFGHLEIVRFLLQKGAAIDVKDYKGKTPLMVAEEYGHDNVIAMLQEAESKTQTLQDDVVECAPMPAANASGASWHPLETPTPDQWRRELVEAVTQREYGRVRTLLTDGGDPNATTEAGDSLLHLAVQSNDHKVLDVLLRAPAIKLDVRNAAGVTPVILAIQKGQRRLATMLHLAAHTVPPDVAATDIEMDTASPLGAGGYGAVFKGMYDGQVVAIKTAANNACIGAMVYEMETMQLCKSPYVLQLLAVSGASTSSPKLVLEYMDGGDLRSYLDAKRLGEPTKVDVSSLEVAWVLANALADMHHSGLLHRDLKSQNVLLSSTNYIKLADLGIAREYESNMSMEKGTWCWMAPEVFTSDSKYSFAADIYSFGVILTELDTLQLPFHEVKDLNRWGIMDRVRLGNLRPTVSATCPPWLRHLADACLSLDPTQRPSAQMIVGSLQKLLGRSKEELASEPETEPSNQGIRLTHSTPESLDDANKLLSRTSSTLSGASATTTLLSVASGTSTGSTTYSSWSNSRLVNTRVACQLCRASNSLLELHCQACKGPLASVASKLKVLLKRLSVAKKNGFEIDDGLCDEELPDDQEKLRILLLRIEQASPAQWEKNIKWSTLGICLWGYLLWTSNKAKRHVYRSPFGIRSVGLAIGSFVMLAISVLGGFQGNDGVAAPTSLADVVAASAYYYYYYYACKDRQTVSKDEYASIFRLTIIKFNNMKRRMVHQNRRTSTQWTKVVSLLQSASSLSSSHRVSYVNVGVNHGSQRRWSHLRRLSIVLK
ncbi:TKL protein kinase [Saprolegnia parasitica CBS 223.65]|uniref:TKL protein kinase n=1 Tax=Saprolegnia parasitica (strain CBS 223.65) TaxID=695850 RepID=A0A067C355_SAPPC|nr:TKL protein kinase [Saprolegnia parasitica CBS 223.65]KDO21001.1 TKL protein kinase [Saprolegnia parasitica CBS 223.65]|eukprot:XP_012208317.1 TKL protein kinase [Saprolegnia parasitica CBS 223.65]